MFFDINLLCRKKQGKFALIWLAATRGIHCISRNEINNVDVAHTCEQLLQYIMSNSLSPRRRFSLVLSAKLYYGTVLVHQQQVRNLQGQIFCFICRIRRPISIIDPELLPEDGLRDGPPAKKKRKTKKTVKVPAIVEALPGPLQVNPENVTDAANITLRDEIRSSQLPVQDLFGDEGQLDLQLALLENNSWGKIIQDTAEFPTLETESGVEKRKSDAIPETSPAKRNRTGEAITAVVEVVQHGQLSPNTPILELMQQEQQNILNQMQWSPDLRRDRRYTQPPPEYHHSIIAPCEEVQVQLPQDIPVQPSTNALEPQDANIVVALEEVLVPVKRKRVRLPRQNNLQVLEDLRRWKRHIKINEAECALLNISVRQGSLTNRVEETSDILSTMLAGLQQPEGDLSRVVRDVHESNASIRSGPRDLTLTDIRAQASLVEQSEILGEHTIGTQALLMIDEQPALKVPSPRLSRIPVPEIESIVLEPPVNIEIERCIIIEEAPPVQLRLHTSTPVIPNEFDTEAERHKRLLDQIRRLFLKNSNTPLKIEQLCSPPVTRYKIGTTFHGLLHLHSKQYIRMESLPHSIELNVITPGRRIL